MNLVALAPLWLDGLLCALVIAAAVEDFHRLRISNAITAGVLLSAIAAASLHGWSIDVWQNVVVFVILLALGTIFFASGQVGGGDVKLLAAVGLWTDFQRALILLPAVFIAGGALAVVVLSLRLFPQAANGINRRSRSRRIPYGVAIAIGTLISVALQVHATS